jgi:hypothetical protein
VTTHENEIVVPVNLADDRGRLLNPAARGWSRTPMHTANLSGVWGRTKKWDYWAILAGDLIVSGVYADVDYLGTVDVSWLDLADGTSGGRGFSTADARGITLPDVSGAAPLTAQHKNLTYSVHDDASGDTLIEATWTEKTGERGSLKASIDLPPGHESLSVVIPWTTKRYQFTTKHQARPAHGELVVGDRHRTFGDGADEAWGVIDIGRGRWPYHTLWNWGGGAGHATNGSVIGLQLGGKWTVGTGYTENGLLVDGHLSKIGTELIWDYSWDDPMQPWHVTDPKGQVDIKLTPRHDKHDRLELKVMSRETHLVFGTWSGTVTDDSGKRFDFTGLQGFAEESRARW